MTPYIISAVLLALLTLGVVMFSRDAKEAPEVPPAEERPYVPQPSQDAMEEAKRIEAALVAEYRRERERFLREAFAARRDAKVKAEIDRLVREVEHG